MVEYLLGLPMLKHISDTPLRKVKKFSMQPPPDTVTSLMSLAVPRFPAWIRQLDDEGWTTLDLGGTSVYDGRPESTKLLILAGSATRGDCFHDA